jgi:CBS domain-containing protein
MKRALAAEVMSSPVLHTRPERSVVQAVRLMRDHSISGLPVLDPDGHLVGIITERDIIAREAGVGGRPLLDYSRHPNGGTPAHRLALTVGDLMERHVVTAGPDTPAREIARLMLRHRINRIPIVEDDGVVGIVTRADILAIFERPARAILADVRCLLRDDLLINPDTLDIVVREGLVQIRGGVPSPGDLSLVDTYVAEIDGVTAVDTSQLVESLQNSA